MIIGAETSEFMMHAYQAAYSGNLVQMPETVKIEMLKVVIDDIFTVVRTLPVADRVQFADQVKHRLAGGH